jgi:tRNA(Ile)-lysidine synthetase-like protein
VQNRTHQILLTTLGASYVGQRFILAVSGGVDSVVLLHVFSRLLARPQFVVAHYNHGLRGSASDSDQSFVAHLCAEKNLTFETKNRPPTSSNSEADLRHDRRFFLETVRQTYDAAWIVTAHHADDQFETFLMRLVRGTGLEGLKSMSIVDGHFLKPWLEINRAPIKSFAAREKIEWVEDESNTTDRYLRNRIRRTVVPPVLKIAEEFGGEEEFYRRFSALVADISKVVREESDRAEMFFKTFAQENRFWIRVPQSEFRQLAEDERLRFLRFVVKRRGGDAPDRTTLLRWDEKLLRRTKRACRYPLSKVVVAECSLEFIFFRGSEPLVSELPQFKSEGRGHWFCDALDLRLHIAPELVARGGEPRFFRPGDRLGKTKLKEVFLKRRVPAPERPFIPLLAIPQSHEILWVFPDVGNDVTVETARFPFSFLSPQSFS